MVRKHNNRSKENFARLPLSVLESEACKTLTHAKFRVLVILASQWRGVNNGTLALTELYAREYGLSGRDTLYGALRDLEQRGLIVCTRRGFKSKKMFSLWALGWESITHRDGKPLDTPEPKNNTRWLNWKDAAPRPKKKTFKRRKTVPTIGTQRQQPKTEIHTDHREQTVPTIGTNEAVSVPIVNDRLPVSVPTIGNTSRTLERATERSAALPAPDSLLNPLPSASGRTSKLDERIRKAKKHLASDPDADVCRLYGITPAELQQVKATA